jgi:hypothetical protein
MNRRDGGGGRDDSGDLGTAIEHVPSWRSTVRSLVTTAIIVAMATPAYAQLSPGSGAPPTGAPATGSPGAASPQGGRPSITLGGEKKAKTEDEIKYERELDEAYKSGLNKIPDQKAKADPWGNIRGAATSQSTASQKRPGSK